MFRVLALFLLITLPASAQSLSESTGLNSLIQKPPTAEDLMLEMHQFDLFQLSISDVADKRGDDAIKSLAKTEAAAAEQRGDALIALQKKAGLSFAFPEEVNKARDNRLSGLGGSVAEIFVREYYAAQRAEYDSVLASLKRYVAKPDNDIVQAFAEKQIIMLEASLKKIETAQTEGPTKPAGKAK